MVAMGLKHAMQSSVGIIPEEFDKILKDPPASTWKIKITASMSPDAAARLVSLLDAHGIDGIKYVNRNEPPGRTGGDAYFVLRSSQIEVVDRDFPVSGKFEATAEENGEVQ